MLDSDIRILLVEDDEVDVMAIKRAFLNKRVANELIVAKDGFEALEYLRGQGPREKVRRPHIILLDINMPRMNGLEFLGEVRNDPSLHDSIIFVLTTSNSDEDRFAAYEKNVAGYILKSSVGDGFISAIAMLNLYWKIVELPA